MRDKSNMFKKIILIIALACILSSCNTNDNEIEVVHNNEEELGGLPTLMLKIGKETYETLIGDYELNKNESGDLPLLVKDEDIISVEKLVAIELSFNEEPINVSAKRWLVSKAELNMDGFNTKEIETELVGVEGQWIRVQGGFKEAVYEVSAEFEQGQVSYVFIVKLEGSISDTLSNDVVEEDIVNENHMEISDISGFFDVEIKEITYMGDYIHKQAEYEITTVNGGTFGYNPRNNEIIQLGIGPTKHNAWSNIVNPFVRTADYFTDYDGGRFIEANAYNGYIQYTSQKNIKSSDYQYLIEDNQYVDGYNRLRDLELLTEVYEIVSPEEISSLDYNKEFIAYRQKGSHELTLIDRQTKEKVSLGSIGSFYRLTGDQVLYQKNGETYGLYTYKDGEERKNLDYLVFDAVYIEGKLYYLDLDLNVYRLDLTGPVLITESQVTEYVFDDEYMILCQRDDMLHVLYKLIDEELEFVRCLTLESMAIYDWHFTDGQVFYYNGSYEISNTFSSSLEIGQEYGRQIYENDQIDLTYFSHYSYEFSGSTLQIYDKEKNKYTRIDDLWYLSGYRVEGDRVFVLGTDYGDRHDIVYKLDFKNYVYKLVESIEPEKNQQYFIADYSEDHDVKVIVNESDYGHYTMKITNLNGQITYDEFKGDFQVLKLKENGFYYVDYSSGVFYYDYTNQENNLISGVDKSYRVAKSSSGSLMSEYYLNDLSQLVQLNYDSGETKIILDKSIQFARHINGDFFCVDKDNNLYYIGDSTLILHAFGKNERLSDDLLYSEIAKIDNQIILVDTINNEVIKYDLAKETSENLDLFWIEGNYSGVRADFSNEEASYYISVISNNKWEEISVNDSSINKMNEDNKIVQVLGITDYISSKVEQLKDNIYLVGILRTEGEDYEYSIYNSQEETIFKLNKEKQKLKDYFVSGDILKMYYGTTRIDDEISYFPYSISYDLRTSKEGIRDNYIYLNQGYDDFVIGGDVNRTKLEKVIINQDGFTLDLGPNSQTSEKGDQFAPYTSFRYVSGAISITVSNLYASYEQFDGLKELGYIGEYHIDKVSQWTYLYFVYKDIEAFTCEFEVGDDGFIDYRFIFK